MRGVRWCNAHKRGACFTAFPARHALTHVWFACTIKTQGEAGVVVPDEGYLREAQKLLHKHNALLIADEVGCCFVCEHEGDLREIKAIDCMRS